MKFFYKTLALIFIFCTSFNGILAKADSIENLDIKASKAITIDMDTKEIIYTKDADIKAQPASTTKLMTALLLAENKEKSDLLPFTLTASNQPSSAIVSDLLPNIEIGETFTAENVMNALMLHSANDMACVIAESISGNLDDFAKLMNKKAKTLSMNNTNFFTPSGLDSDEILNGNEHYTTAYDLALLGIAAFNNTWVRSSMALKDNIPFPSTSSDPIMMKNGNKNLNINGCIGGKTGFTTKAGRCLVAIYEREGRKIIGVVLGSTYPDYFKDMESIIDYSYSTEKTVLYKKFSEFKSENITFSPFKYFGPKKYYTMPLMVKEDILQYDNSINKNESNFTIDLCEVSPLELDEKTIVGSITVNERDASKTYNIYTTLTSNDIIKDNISIYFSVICLIFSFIIILIHIIIMCFIQKNIKKQQAK